MAAEILKVPVDESGGCRRCFVGCGFFDCDVHIVFSGQLEECCGNIGLQQSPCSFVFFRFTLGILPQPGDGAHDERIEAGRAFVVI